MNALSDISDLTNNALTIENKKSLLHYRVDKRVTMHGPSNQLAERVSSPKVHFDPYSTIMEEVTDTETDLSEEESCPKNFPIYGYGHEGIILYRMKSTFISRKWQAAYWLHVKPSWLLFFDSNEHKKKWKELHTEKNQSKECYKKFDSTGDKLIVWHVNFDAMCYNRRRIERARVNTGIEYESPLVFDAPPKASSKKIYTMENVYSKNWKQKDNSLHTFNMQTWSSSSGKIQAFKLASTEVKEVKLIRKTIRYCIDISSKAGLEKGNNKKHKKSEPKNTNRPTVVCGSSISGLSSTIYGKEPVKSKSSFKKPPVARKVSFT